MSKSKKLSTILKIFFISIILPVIIGYILNNIFIGKYTSIPIHSVLEAIGGFIALILAFIIFKLFNNRVLNHLHYTSIALIAMGIIDIFHASVIPGEMFIWLHSLAVLVGGLLFLTVFFKDIEVSNSIYLKLPIFIGLTSIFISIFSILNPQLIPLMLNEDKTFTDFSIAMNIIGGISFIVAGLYYSNRYIKYSYEEDILFVGHTFLFGIAGILFASSSLWDAQWWLWHILRLSAYLIVLHYMYSIFNYQIAQNEKEKKVSNNILNAQSNFTVITDGRKLIKVNQTVLDFFGYKTLNDLKKEHNCICDYFIKEEGYLYQDTNNDKENWLDTVLENLNHNHQVKILDQANNTHIFQINTSGEKLEDQYVVTFTDITLREQLYRDNMLQEKILLEQSKMAAMGEMLGNIAHQWRQPLNTISMSVSGMHLKSELNLLTTEDIKKFSHAIVQSTKFLSDTIETFRNFLKDDKISRKISIQEEILQAKNITHALLQSKSIEIRDNIDHKNNIIIDMASGELTQVLINIINNSKDILQEKELEDPWIELNLIKESDNFTITIEDNGGGIPEDILPKIFEPYFTTKHQSQGTGLGLHMSYRIITESLKGRLWIENTNNGAKFFIEVPLES